MGKIGVLVALKGGDETIAKQIAMHVAATNPASLSEDDLAQLFLLEKQELEFSFQQVTKLNSWIKPLKPLLKLEKS
jgi:translation elongation factor EF-Ts